VALALLLEPIVGNAGLIATDGGLGVYDATNNVTWVSDANLFATQAVAGGNAAAFVQTIISDSGGFISDTPNDRDHPAANSGSYQLSSGDFNTATGQMDWWGAQAWVNYLNATDYGGSNHWALPTTVDAQSSVGQPNGVAVSSGQLLGLFYGQLGGTAGSNFLNTLNGSAALFSNLQSVGNPNGQSNPGYWSGTEWINGAASADSAWDFFTSNGDQQHSPKNLSYYAVAVAPGEVGSPVPLPPTAWLLLSALGGLGAHGRKGRAGDHQ
jgi:hypothetical protein